MLELIENWLVQQSLDIAVAHLLTKVVAYLAVIFLSIVANFVVKRVILSVVRSMVSRSKTDLDDILVQRKIFSKL